MELNKPDCMNCEHNEALTPSVLRKCKAGAFDMLQTEDCKDLPYFVLEKCPKFKDTQENKPTLAA